MPPKRTDPIKFIFFESYCMGYCAGSNQEFIFDLEDYEKIKNYIWTLSKNKWGNYVHARINGKWTYLHRYLVGASKGQYVDHIDRNSFNNKKSNLRICTNMENSYNHKANMPESQNVIGVPYNKRDMVWTPTIRIDGKRKYLGYFKDERLAIIARLKAEKEHYGEFAPQKHLFKEYGI